MWERAISLYSILYVSTQCHLAYVMLQFYKQGRFYKFEELAQKKREGVGPILDIKSKLPFALVEVDARSRASVWLILTWHFDIVVRLIDCIFTQAHDLGRYLRDVKNNYRRYSFSKDSHTFWS